jgi:hypothetical protein
MANSTIRQHSTNQKAANTHTTNPTLAQLNKLQQLVFTRDTAITFTQSLRLLFVLVKESLVLLWLGLCYGLVAAGWLMSKVFHLGGNTKIWVNSIQEASREQSVSEIATEVGKTVLTSSKVTFDQVMTQAKKQVGLLDEENQ